MTASHVTVLHVVFLTVPLSLHSAYNTGEGQSPIDLVKRLSINAEFPLLTWNEHWIQRAEGFQMKNSHNTVLIYYPDQNSNIVGGPLSDAYILEQIHFHWGDYDNGTEHAINHVRFALEAHIVHYKAEYGSFANATLHVDGLAVIGLIFEVSSVNNNDTDELITGLRYVREYGSSTILPPNSMAWLENFARSQNYYTYKGSLTTPPYSEIVTWIVMEHRGFIGVSQLQEFYQLEGPDDVEFSANVRPLQPINGRNVFYSQEEL